MYSYNTQYDVGLCVPMRMKLLYSLCMLDSTFARRVIVEHKIDALVTVGVKLSSLPTFKVTHYIAFLCFILFVKSLILLIFVTHFPLFFVYIISFSRWLLNLEITWTPAFGKRCWRLAGTGHMPKGGSASATILWSKIVDWSIAQYKCGYTDCLKARGFSAMFPDGRNAFMYDRRNAKRDTDIADSNRRWQTLQSYCLCYVDPVGPLDVPH